MNYITAKHIKALVEDDPTIKFDIDNGMVTVSRENELLTYFPIMRGERGYRIIYSDYGIHLKGKEKTVDDKKDAVDFFYVLLKEMVGENK